MLHDNVSSSYLQPQNDQKTEEKVNYDKNMAMSQIKVPEGPDIWSR